MTGLKARESLGVRTWPIAITVVLSNALVQALLTISNPTPSATWWIWPLWVVSFLAITFTAAVFVAALSLAAQGQCHWRTVLTQVRSRALPWLGYASALSAIALIGFVFWIIPGIIVLALTPYLPFAVMGEHPNPVRSNFRAIRAGWGRWIGLCVVSIFIVAAIWLGSSLASFFVPGVVGGFLIWLAIGFVGMALLRIWFHAWQHAHSAITRD
jgi:hypothetical protein